MDSNHSGTARFSSKESHYYNVWYTARQFIFVKIGLDAAENEPSKMRQHLPNLIKLGQLCVPAKSSPRPAASLSRTSSAASSRALGCRLCAQAGWQSGCQHKKTFGKRTQFFVGCSRIYRMRQEDACRSHTGGNPRRGLPSLDAAQHANRKITFFLSSANSSAFREITAASSGIF